MAKRSSLVVAAVFALATGLSAQQGSVQGPALSGVVVDAVSGVVVPNASVYLSSTAQQLNSPLTSHNVLASAKTDGNGKFSFLSMITRPARVDFPFETSVAIYFAVHKDSQVLDVRRVEVVSIGGSLPVDQGPSRSAEVKIFTAAPEPRGR